ncbi:MAG: hypothetical protein STHCBS139747_005079 [Sporothrix thermara]
MCITWFHISYCEACRAYIDSYRLGTVFCSMHDANLPCETEKSIDEAALPGPCTTCQPPPQLRRSKRLYLRSLREGEKKHGENGLGEDECTDNNAAAAEDDEMGDADDDKSEDGTGGEDSDDGNGGTGGDDLNDMDYRSPDVRKKDGDKKNSKRM